MISTSVFINLCSIYDHFLVHINGRLLLPPLRECSLYTATLGIRRQPCMETRLGYVDAVINHIFSTSSVMDRPISIRQL